MRRSGFDRHRSLRRQEGKEFRRGDDRRRGTCRVQLALREPRDRAFVSGFIRVVMQLFVCMRIRHEPKEACQQQQLRPSRGLEQSTQLSATLVHRDKFKRGSCSRALALHSNEICASELQRYPVRDDEIV